MEVITMANEPIIYDENNEGKVTKVTNSDEGVKIDQYHPERGMNIIGFDPAETKRLLRDVKAALTIESDKELPS